MVKYRDESGKMWTKEELRKDYAEFLLESPETYDCISFDDYMNDATGKNGSLTAINTLSETEKENITKTAETLKSAFLAFALAMQNVSTDSFNKYLAEEYPFTLSFDEMPFYLLSWLDIVKEDLNNLEAEN